MYTTNLEVREDRRLGERRNLTEVLRIPAPLPTQRAGDSPTTTCSPIHRLPGVPIAAQGFGRNPQQRSQQQRPPCCHEATVMDSERPGTAGSRDSDELPLKAAETWVLASRGWRRSPPGPERTPPPLVSAPPRPPAFGRLSSRQASPTDTPLPWAWAVT